MRGIKNGKFYKFMLLNVRAKTCGKGQQRKGENTNFTGNWLERG